MAQAENASNDSEYARDDPVGYSARQRLLDAVELVDEGTEIHLASVAEKQRLWWKDAVINSFFIASWCVIPFCKAN
jgi:hypothetical protein